MIALKAELAGRLLDAGEDVGVARVHVGELEGVARKALSEVRETASGYRRPVLALKLDGARMALEAGIEAGLDRAGGSSAGCRGAAGVDGARGDDQRDPPLRGQPLLGRDLRDAQRRASRSSTTAGVPRA